MGAVRTLQPVVAIYERSLSDRVYTKMIDDITWCRAKQIDIGTQNGMKSLSHGFNL